MLRKSTNLLLTRTLSGCLQNLIKKPHIGLTEVNNIARILNLTTLLEYQLNQHYQNSQPQMQQASLR